MFVNRIVSLNARELPEKPLEQISKGGQVYRHDYTTRGKDLTNNGNSHESKLKRSLPLELGWLLKEVVVSRDDERENRLGRTLADKE